MDGHISSEGAFLVNVSAVDSLMEKNGRVNTIYHYSLAQLHHFILRLHQHCHKALSSEP